MSLAIVTGVYGGYDPVRPLGDTGFDDAICVTDNPDLVAPGWRVIVDPRPEHPRLAAKRPKMTPWIYTRCDSIVWVDASFSVSDGFSGWAVPQLQAHDFIAWRHPDRASRACFVDEARICQDWPKYRDWNLRGQVEHYLADGMPTGWGLYAAGVLGWRFTPTTMAFGRRWLREQYEWSIQDQVSLPYLLWKTGMPFGTWDGEEFQNPYLTWHGHTRND